MSDIVWDKLSEKKRKRLTQKTTKLARKFAKINYARPARAKLTTKIKFKLCRFIQKKVRKSGVGGLDCAYWQEQGWLGKNRPWKKRKSK